MLLGDDKIWDQNSFNDLVHRQLGPSVDEESGLVYAYDGSLKLGLLLASIFCSGHTYFVQAYAAVKYADCCLRGLRGDAGIVECAYVASQVTKLPFFATQVKLGRGGAEEVLQLGLLNEYERAGLEEAKKELATSIEKGVTFIRK